MIKELIFNKKLYIWLFSLIVAGFALLYTFDNFIMPYYTNYNEGLTVPDVTRISLDEAETLLATYGLRYEVADRRSNSAYPADYVIDQTPSAMQIVKPNRKIYLTVNTQIRPQVIVPNVESLSFRNAQIQLQNYGLEVGSVSYESSRFKNVILRQSIPQGTSVDKGTVIDLVVSDGLGDRIVDVPEIIGLRLPQAQLKLREAGLNIGEILFKPVRDTIPNTVLDFEPKVEQLREGETINLVISERFEAIEQSEDGAVIIDSTDQNAVSEPDTLNSNNNQN